MSGVGCRVSGGGCRVAGLAENITNSVKLELELGLSLAKKIIQFLPFEKFLAKKLCRFIEINTRHI